MAEPGQLVNPVIMRRGVTFYLPLRIDDTVAPLDWTGKEVRFQVKDRSDPNAECCDDSLVIDLSSEDDPSLIDLSLFTMSLPGTSPVVQGNFRLTIPGQPSEADPGNQDGVTLTKDQACQDTTFQIVVRTPGATDEDFPVDEPLVVGRISIVGL